MTPETTQTDAPTIAAEIKSHSIMQNDPLTVTALDGADSDGAHTSYTIGFPLPPEQQGEELVTRRHVDLLQFQKGPVAKGPNGITDECLLAIVAHRMSCRAQKNPHDQAFRQAMGKTREALIALHRRSADRKLRGVEGTILV